MQILQDHLNELEFPKLLEEITPYAYSPRVAEKISNIKPLPQKEAEFLLKKTSEFLSSYESENFIPFDEYEDIEEPLKLMLIENFRLEASAFLRIRKITEQIGKLQSFFPKFSENFPNLEEEIKIRESTIEDQRVLAVKSGFKKRVSGRVLGVSKTGSITYIQPDSVVRHYHQLRESEEEQKKEVDRILRKLTSEIAEFHPQLSDYQEYLYNLDITRAKAKFAEKINGVLPKINTHKTLKLIDAYHPLLWLRNTQENKAIYPQTLELSEENRIICISGPNAGGKSITLKALGLLQLMIQSGILVPVHPRSEMFFFDKLMTDIGDNQSIENHLSTYSSRLKKMSRIVREADENTLLLIDEFGTGSDPELGGALAEAFLEFFYEKESFAVITTHYTNIKLVVEQLPHAQNAAMLFDEETLEPMYKLEVGQAGSSFTFEVAEKNNIPRFIIHSAKKKIERDVVNLDKTIVKLQQEKFEVEKLKSDLTEKREITQNKRDNLQKLNEQLQQKLYNFQKLYEEEHRKLQFGTRIQSFIDDYAKGKSRKDIVKDFIKILEQEKFRKNQNTEKIEAEKLKVVKRKVTQELKKESVIQTITETQEKIQERERKERALWLKVGQRVRIIGSTSTGTIEKLDSKTNKATINYGLFKTQISTDELERV